MDIIINGIYKHFKGNYYKVIGIAKHSEILDEMVVYQAQYGEKQLWVRPVSTFNEIITRDGIKINRFSYIPENIKEQSDNLC